MKLASSAPYGTGGDVMMDLRENTHALHEAIEADVARLGAPDPFEALRRWIGASEAP